METSPPNQAKEAKPQAAAGGRSPSAVRRLPAARSQIFLWAGALLLIGLVHTFWPKFASQEPGSASLLIPVSGATLWPESTPTPSPVAALLTPPPPRPAGVIDLTPPTPPPGGVTIMLAPAAGTAGWVTSLDGRSHLNVPNIHAGFFEGHIYHGLIQFDLSAVPPGSTITYAALELVGLDGQNLRPAGAWQLRLLDPAIDAIWPTLTYDALRHAGIETTVSSALTSTDLAPDRVNVFPFASGQLSALQQRLANGMISFRLDGPASGTDNLFTWDSGYRSGRILKTRPVLRLVVIPPPAPEYVIVTSTPTPENIITAAAIAATATELAHTAGAYTPVPENWVTPVVVTPQPTPANTATAAYEEAVATAETFLFGTATPTPLNVWTATPAPDNAITPDNGIIPGTLVPDSTAMPSYVIVTGVPAPENVITVAAMAAAATRVAVAIGTYTPVPENWVTPIVVTPRPTPANPATAAYQKAVATAEAYLFGPATPTPLNVWTATPTPVFILLDGQIATPWATFTPTATPQPIPSMLVGKIAFLSNRSGGPEPLEEPLVYVIDPDGSNLAVLTDRAVYDAAVARDSYSADQRFRVFVKDAIRFDGKRVPVLYFYDYFYNAEEQITHFGAGVAWDPVWSPAREQIAFVSNDSSDDEIWVVDRGGSNLRRLTSTNETYNAREIGKDTFIPEVNGHPSWSPDGLQIVFWSNRTGNRQIWMMNADGSNQYSLSTTNYDDWDPVWIKYTDPARDPAPDLAKSPPENP